MPTMTQWLDSANKHLGEGTDLQWLKRTSAWDAHRSLDGLHGVLRCRGNHTAGKNSFGARGNLYSGEEFLYHVLEFHPDVDPEVLWAMSLWENFIDGNTIGSGSSE